MYQVHTLEHLREIWLNLRDLCQAQPIQPIELFYYQEIMHNKFLYCLLNQITALFLYHITRMKVQVTLVILGEIIGPQVNLTNMEGISLSELLGILDLDMVETLGGITLLEGGLWRPWGTIRTRRKWSSK